ncbi:hypothetical protein KKI23_02680 [Patescibacteria group bacterium]|nr:hypothetical protein [Patescibacteria group bacterium]
MKFVTEKEISHDFSDERDFSNEDIVMRVLESGTADDLEKLREHHGFTQEQIELFRYYAQLRKQTLDEIRQDLDERERNNPTPIEDELNMGAYMESIEPQVQKTVLALRKKGYNTILSGFSGFDGQEIQFADNKLEEFTLSEELLAEAHSAGVQIEIKPDAISFRCERQLPLNELERLWVRIEEDFPDLGEPALASQLRSAESFRKRHSS